MTYKVFFTSDARRQVEADQYAVDNHLLVFLKDNEPVLSCVMSNVSCWHPAEETGAGLPLAAQVGSSRAGSKAHQKKACYP
jgi:hypothetical protein